jgi:hypothetical protein
MVSRRMPCRSWMTSSRVSDIHSSYLEFSFAEITCRLVPSHRRACLRSVQKAEEGYSSGSRYPDSVCTILSLTPSFVLSSSIHACRSHPYALALIRNANSPLCSTKLILPGELAKHAQSEGCKTLRRFNQHTKQGLR